MRPAASTTRSSRVATAKVVALAAATNAAVSGGVPSSTEPVSVSATLTVSGAVAAPDRVSVKTAAVPSTTELVCAAMDTSGNSGATGAVAALVRVSRVPPPSVKLTRTLMLLPASPATSV